MRDYLASISRQAKTSIFVDDAPLISQADLNVESNLKDALDGVAKAFGYRWEVSKTGAILMRKHYRDPEDRPQFSLPELLKTAQDTTSVLGLIPYETGAQSTWYWKMRGLFQLLSPLQRSQLLSGHTLQAADLSPEQFEVLQRVILQVAFGSLRVAWTSMLEHLETMPSSHLERGEKSSSSYPSLFYVYKGRDGTVRRVNLFRDPRWAAPAEGAGK